MGKQKPKSVFNPDSSGFDEDTGTRLAKEYPLTIPKPSVFQGDVLQNDSFQAWVWHKDLGEYKLHGSSLDPKTGMVLKGKNHPTWNLMEEEEIRRGNTIIKRDGRYYSVPMMKPKQ